MAKSSAPSPLSSSTSVPIHYATTPGPESPTAAFVLGLFISRTTDQEALLSHRLEPLRDRLFVPVFFFGLGTLVEPRLILTFVFPLAVATGLLLFVLRRLGYDWFFARRLGTTPAAHVLAAPMLTIAAVAVDVLARAGADQRTIAWILASSLSLTLLAAFARVGTDTPLAEIEPAMAAPQAWDQTGVNPSLDSTDSSLARSGRSEKKEL